LFPPRKAYHMVVENRYTRPWASPRYKYLMTPSAAEPWH
jgi:hypothetical protein